MTDSQRPTREQLLGLKGKYLLVSDLLALFGMRYRSPQTVPIVLEALKDAELATMPSFATCGTKTSMLVVHAAAAPATAQDDAEAEGELGTGTLPQHSFKVGDIPTAGDGLVSVQPSDTLAQATTLMRTKNFSQLPVIAGTSDLRGVVTWSSIASRYEQGKTPTLANAMVTDDLPVAEVHQQLFSRLPAVAEHGYLLVRSNSGSLSGIVTASDIAARFQTTALPFFLVGEIEFRLRKCLGAKLTPEAIRAVQSKKTGQISDLMFGQYVRLLRESPNNPDADNNWKALGWTVTDRTQFVHQLDRVREIRNAIAHFDTEPLPPERIDELREFSGLLKQLV